GRRKPGTSSQAGETAKKPGDAKPSQSAQLSSPEDPLAGMSREERRAALEKMTPEQRAAYRERRKAARESGQGGQGVAAMEGHADIVKQPRPGTEAAETDDAGGGFTDQNTARRTRQGTVKVIDADGQIEQRSVEVGVTNRVQMQVVSGLKEGDEVIVGLKLPPSAAHAQNGGGARTSGLGQAPRGMR
ncbi:MAG TPA: efflux RND transporter periplasmic adaptor subunit, partial [Oxalicibacterium sp.]|nr:efflux RND transporter periplasmic adaptor subunit [Oxalicibacterium sp.]